MLTRTVVTGQLVGYSGETIYMEHALITSEFQVMALNETEVNREDVKGWGLSQKN